MLARRIFLSAALFTLPGCSSSPASAPDAGVDATTDAAEGSVDTGAGDDGAESVDAAPVEDGGIDAPPDGPPVPCSTGATCGVHAGCCLGTTAGACAPTCGCEVSLLCASGADCPSNQVCCLQPTTIGCTPGTHTSICLPTCFGAGFSQMCRPTDAGGNECLQGSCTGANGLLVPLGIPADAGFGLCH